MHTFDLIVIALYMVTIVAVGLGLSRKVTDAEDYFLAGKSLAFWVIGLSIIGTNIGADSYVGASGGAHRWGIAQANFEWIGAIPAMILASVIFIPVYWRAGVYSIPEYLGKRYSQSVRVLAATMSSVFAVVAIAVALWAIALTLKTYLGWETWVGIMVTGTVVALYSITGGLRAVAFTDILQVTIMFVGGISIAYLGVTNSGGLVAFVENLTSTHPEHLQAFLPADHSSFPWPGVLLGLAIVLSPAYWCGSQAILQRTLAARSEWDASASMMMAAFGKTCIPLLVVFPGLLALVMNADIGNSDQALPWVIKNVLPPGLSGLMFIALIAALQSSIDSGVNSTALLITRDITGVLSKKSNPERDLKIGRFAALMILIFGMICAPLIEHMGGIYLFIQSMLSLFQGPMLALLGLGAFTRFATPASGLITIACGITLSAVLLFLGWNLLYVAFISFVASLLVIVIVSSQTEPAKDLDRLVFSFRRKPTGEPEQA